jgi:hypothetical protein
VIPQAESIHNDNIAKTRMRKIVSDAAIAVCGQQARKYARRAGRFSENLPIGALLRPASQSALGSRIVLCNNTAALGDKWHKSCS